MPIDTFRQSRAFPFPALLLTVSLITSSCAGALARPVATARPAVRAVTPTTPSAAPTATPAAPTESAPPAGPTLRTWTMDEAIEWLRESQRSYFLGTGDYGDVSADATALLAAEVAGRYAEAGSATHSRLTWEFVLSRIATDPSGYGASDAMRVDFETGLESALNAAHPETLHDALQTLAWERDLTADETQTIWKKEGRGAWVVGMQTTNGIVMVVWLEHDAEGLWTARLLSEPLVYVYDIPTVITANVAGESNIDVVIADTELSYDYSACADAAIVIVDPTDAATLESAQRVSVVPQGSGGNCGSWRVGVGTGANAPRELVYSADIYVANECDWLTDEQAYRWVAGTFSKDPDRSGLTLPPAGSACSVLWALRQGRGDPYAFDVIEAALADWPDQLDTIIGPAARDYLRLERAMRYAYRGLPGHADDELAALISHPSGKDSAFAITVARAYRDAMRSDGLWSPCTVAQQVLVDAMPEDLWSYGYESAAPALREAYGFSLPGWTERPDLACAGPSFKSAPLALSFDDEAALADWLSSQKVTLTVSNRVDLDEDGQLDWLIVNATSDEGMFEWHIFLQRDGQLTHVLQGTILAEAVDAIDAEPIAITDGMAGWLITSPGSVAVARISAPARLLFERCACSAVQDIATGELTLDNGETYRYDSAEDAYLYAEADTIDEPSIEADLATATAALYFEQDAATAQRLIASALSRIGDETGDDAYWIELRSRALYLEASALEESDPAEAVAKYQALSEAYPETLAGWLAHHKLTP